MPVVKKKPRSSSKSSRKKSAPWKPWVTKASKISARVGKWFGNLTENIEKRFKAVAEAVGGVLNILFSILVPKSLRKSVDGLGKSKQAKKLGSQVGEITEKVEKQFSSTATNVFEVFGFLGAILVPRIIREPVARVWKAFTKGVGRFFKRLSKGLDKWAEKYLPAWLLNFVRRASKLTKRNVRHASRFWTAWGKTRDFKALAWSTPAVLMSLPIFGMLTLSAVNTNGDKILHYRRVTMEADLDGDVRTADLFRQKLRQLGYLQMELAEYSAALAIEQQEGPHSLQEAFERMKEIAPLDSLAETGGVVDRVDPDAEGGAAEEGEIGGEEEDLGFLPAHVWIVDAAITKGLECGTEEEKWKLVEDHLEVALTIDPRDVSARYYKVLADQHAGRSVESQMISLAREYPQFSADLMRYHHRLGETAKARSYARKFLRYVDGVPEEQKRALHYSSESLALQLTGNAEGALEIAEAGFSKFKDDRFLTELALQAVTMKLNALDPNDPAVLPLLKQAHIANRDDLDIVKRLATKLVYDEFNARPVVDELKGEGRCAPEIFLMAGDIHAGAARWDEARAMFEEAVEVDENCGRGLNNVAWILANIPPVRLAQALELVNTAIERDPSSQCYETRGQIFFRMRRWDEAISDLERSLNGVLPDTDTQKAHESLAAAYEQIGQPERAAAHRSRALVSAGGS